MKQPKECCPEMDSTPYLYYFIIYLTGALQVFRVSGALGRYPELLSF